MDIVLTDTHQPMMVASIEPVSLSSDVDYPTQPQFYPNAMPPERRHNFQDVSNRRANKLKKRMSEEDKEAWKLYSKHLTPFLAVPPEIHLKILEFLNPVDSVCLSLTK